MSVQESSNLQAELTRTSLLPKGLASRPLASRQTTPRSEAGLSGVAWQWVRVAGLVAVAASEVAVAMRAVGWCRVWRQSLSRSRGPHGGFHSAYGTNGLKLTRMSSPLPRLNLYKRPSKSIRTSLQVGIAERGP